jgi:RNA polymerase sigma-70 factor (ECF subfamily)
MRADDADTSRQQDVLERLIRRAARGDLRSFSVLYAMTSPRIFGLILHMTDYSQSCEDLLQEVYLKVWMQAKSYQPGKARVATWLNAIARNCTIDWMRQQTSGTERITETRSPDALDLAATVDPELETRAATQNQSLARCMDELSDSQRQAIYLAYLKGMTHSELTRQLGSPLGTVKSWVRRGLESLRNCLRRSGGAP